MIATMSEAHAEWHRNAGVPMGQPGCPQDACDGEPDWDPAWEDDTVLPDEPDPWLPDVEPPF